MRTSRNQREGVVRVWNQGDQIGRRRARRPDEGGGSSPRVRPVVPYGATLLRRDRVVDRGLAGPDRDLLDETPVKTTGAPSSAVSTPALAATPTPIVSSQSPPSPTPVGGQQPALDRDIADLTAFYRLDGGAWHLLWSYSYRVTADGVHLEWLFGPVPANANTFEFAIIPGRRPESDGAFDRPTGDGASPWEWTVPLQEIEERWHSR